MAGVYIHIPFCKSACTYCNFHFSTSLRYKNEFIAALLKEIELQRSFLHDETIDTIYLGGGTPSILTGEELKSVLNAVHLHFKVAGDAELTLEANPDDIDEQKLEEWKLTGINRLSIGVQSFFEEDLRWMNRAHNAAQAAQSLELATKLFPNITIDLIYGTPHLTNEKWKANVARAIDLGVPHLSCYALTVEPKTPLDKMIRAHQSPAIDPDKQSEQLLLLMQWLQDAGYEHYEISNFAKPGFRSRHNSSYWQGKKYLGLGPSAHSFTGNSRQWNISNNQLYIQSIQQNEIPFEEEVLIRSQKVNEYIMTALRTQEGIDLALMAAVAGEGNPSALLIIDQVKTIAARLAARGLLQCNEARVVLTREGKLLADGIASDLFID